MPEAERNKAILITGACGGLGAAAVTEFAKSGYLVYAADISERAAEEGVVPLQMDVTGEESVREAAEKVAEKGVPLCAVIHLAGLYTMDSFIEISPETLEKMLAVNLMGVYRVNREFLPLIRNSGGRIVIVASELAPLDPLPFNGIYTVTKRALDGYAHSLALELDLLGTRVVTVYPGAFGDGMPRAALASMERMSEKSRLYPDIAKRFSRIVAAETGSAKNPAILAKKLRRITEKRSPRFKYFINDSLKLKLFSALPMGAQAFLLRLLLKGKKREQNE